MATIPEDVIKNLKCPCEAVTKQGEKVDETRELMIAIKSDLGHLTAMLEENRRDMKEIKSNYVTREQFENLTKRVEALESLPAKRWNGVVEKIIFAVVSGIAAFALFKLGFPVS